jgi:hypothetical protein
VVSDAERLVTARVARLDHDGKKTGQVLLFAALLEREPLLRRPRGEHGARRARQPARDERRAQALEPAG